MSDLLKSLLIQLIISAVIIFPIWFGISIYNKHVHENDINTYNNGICECSGHYEFINKTHGKIHSEEYVFQCDSCNKIIIFYTNPLE